MKNKKNWNNLMSYDESNCSFILSSQEDYGFASMTLPLELKLVYNWFLTASDYDLLNNHAIVQSLNGKKVNLGACEFYHNDSCIVSTIYDRDTGQHLIGSMLVNELDNFKDVITNKVQIKTMSYFKTKFQSHQHKYDNYCAIFGYNNNPHLALLIHNINIALLYSDIFNRIKSNTWK